MGPTWGEVRVYRRHWPSLGCLPPAPPSPWVPGGASGGAHKERILDFLPPPTPLPFCPLSFPGQWRPSYLLAAEVGKEGGGPVSRCRSRPVPFLGRSPVHCARTEEKGGRRPKPAGLYAPRSHAVILPLTLPPPRSAPRGTLRSHTSCRPCPWGAQQPLARPGTSPRLPCPHRLPLPPPPHQ